MILMAVVVASCNHSNCFPCAGGGWECKAGLWQHRHFGTFFGEWSRGKNKAHISPELISLINFQDLNLPGENGQLPRVELSFSEMFYGSDLWTGNQTSPWNIKAWISCCSISIQLLICVFTSAFCTFHESRYLFCTRKMGMYTAYLSLFVSVLYLFFCNFARKMVKVLHMLSITGGSSLSLTYIAAEKIIPG